MSTWTLGSNIGRPDERRWWSPPSSNALPRISMVKPLLALLLSTALAACGGGGGGGDSPAPGPSNRAPIAAISVDRASGAAPLTVVMNGSGSTDSDGTISSYRFTLNGNALGTTASVQHTFTEPGTYGVTLTITDDDGATGSATATITVTQGDGGPTVLTGVFIDGSVQGLAYRTATQSGLTNASGEFSYVAGETVTFSIGGVELGSAPGAARVTPFDFFGMDPPSTEAAVRAALYSIEVSDFDRVANIARLLVSLDKDRDPGTGIDLAGWNDTLGDASLSFASDLYRFAQAGGEFEKFARGYHVNRNVSLAQPLVYLYRALGITVPAHVNDSLEVDARVDGTVDRRHSFSYDANGYVLSRSRQDYDDAGMVKASESTTSTYDTAGHRLTEMYEAKDDDGDDTADYRSSQIAIHDADGQLLTRVTEIDEGADDTPDSRTSESYTYDIDGRLLAEAVEYDLDADGDTPASRTITRFTYDADGRELSSVYEYETDDSDDRVDYRSSRTSTYDDDGHLLTQVTEIDSDADDRPNSRKSESGTYDTDGRLVTQVVESDTDYNGQPNDRLSMRYSYDDDGRLLTFASEYDADVDGTPDFRMSESTTYDADGRRLTRVTEIHEGADDTPDSRTSERYTYDARGNRLTAVTESDTDADGTPNSRTTFRYTYHADGYRLTERLEIEDGNASPLTGLVIASSYAETSDGLSHLITNPPQEDEE